jgi:hypothetical protein
VFENAYNRNSHLGFHRAFERISETLYLYHLAKRLRRYIKLYHICATYQIKRYALYRQIVLIRPPDIPFYTIAIDFVDKLLSQKRLDALLSVTDKFTKRVLLIPGKMTLTVEEWAVALIDTLRSADWGILRAIISDRDSKFIRAFWKGAFKRLGMNILIITAYYL